MKKWRDSNSILREDITAGKFNADYIDDLKKLISGEAAAAVQYKIASQCITGPGQNYLVGHFNEHSDEEWGHFDSLVSALMVRDNQANPALQSLVSDALPATEELTSFDAVYLRDFFEKAENNAVKAYEEFYEKIKAIDEDLADIVIGIIEDEKEHSLDFSRIL